MIDKKKYITVIISFIMILIFVLFLVLHNVGIMRNVSNEIEQVGRECAGYKEKIYIVKGKDKVPMPIFGAEYIEQEIYLQKKVLESNNLMLEIHVANYDRINEGEFYVQISQNEKSIVYLTEMNQITENKNLRLFFDSGDWEAGYIKLKLYSPDSTAENCIAVYTRMQPETYPNMYVNGEEMNANICADLLVPSKFAKSDFNQIKID